jgi:resuscitation-promoting factor RpfB
VPRSAKLCLYALALIGLVAGAASIVGLDRKVTVAVDGQSRDVVTSAATVQGVLRDADLTVGAHDVVAPAASTPVHAGSLVQLHRGRMLRLDVDGARRDVWTTELTVDQALADLGYGAGQPVGVSRDKRLPLGITDVDVAMPKSVSINADHKHHTVTTSAPTVAGVLAGAHVTLGAHDRVMPSRTARPTPGMKIVVKRVSFRTSTTYRTVHYSTRTVHTSHLYIGTTKIVRAGKNGTARITYRLVYVDGKLYRTIKASTKIVRKPVSRVMYVGTRKPAGNSPTAAKAQARSMVAARGWDSTQYSCLVSLWNKESGWRVHAANPSGAYGIPQALPGAKMASAGPDWQDSAHTQINWGLGYIASHYGTPCGAWAHSQATNWY